MNKAPLGLFVSYSGGCGKTFVPARSGLNHFGGRKALSRFVSVRSIRPCLSTTNTWHAQHEVDVSHTGPFAAGRVLDRVFGVRGPITRS